MLRSMTVNHIGSALFVLFLLLGINPVLELILINFDERIIWNIGFFFLPLAYVVALVFVLGNCLRRRKVQFPTLILGGRQISQRSVKKMWTGILILSFILGWSGRPSLLEMGGGGSFPGQSPVDKIVQQVRTIKYLTSPFLSYEVHESAFGSDANRKVKTDEKIDSRLPLLFFIAVYLYFRGVRRRPKREEEQ